MFDGIRSGAGLIPAALAAYVRRRGGLRQIWRKVVALVGREGLGGLVRAGRTALLENLFEWQYESWVEKYDTVRDADRAAMRERIACMAQPPTISIVMPTYNAQPAWLRAAVDSVRRQAYPHWQLCIADDASTDPAVRPLLEQFAQEDSRIRITFREQNGHISAASNSALRLAQGEWIALLDHDDELAEHALFCVADVIDRHPDVRLIYSDEDKLAGGRRCDPYFKSDWNPELFEAQNMFSHLGVYYRALVEEVGGFRIGFEGSQDYDLALRCVERVAPAQVHHIPRVLYHWRKHEASTAAATGAKPYAVTAAQRALTEHFERLGIGASVEEMGALGYRVRYPLPGTPPRVTLIIPTRNGESLLRVCIDSITRLTTYPSYEILVIDNASDDTRCLAYLDDMANKPGIRVIRDPRPFNFSALNNAAVRQCDSPLVALINNDMEVITPTWLDEMVSHACRPGVGAVGAKLLFPDDTIQHAGVVLGPGGVAAHAYRGVPRGDAGYFGRAALPQSCSAVTAACLVVQRESYLAVGGLNETELAVAFNDVDFCLKLRELGLRNVWTPFAELYHHESATRGAEDTRVKRARFNKEVRYMQNRWGNLLRTDPAYNPNLSLGSFSHLARPPRLPALGES